MDHCDSCAFVYADLGVEDAPATLRAYADDYGRRLRLQPVERIRTRPSPEVWSALEYACHMRDVFEVQRERALLALDEGTPTFVPMGREERVIDRRYNEQDPETVAAAIERAAEALALTFETLDETEWARTGIYNWPTPTERDLAWLARHTVHEARHHLRDIDDGLR